MIDPIANGEDGADIRTLKLNPSLAKSNLLGEYDVAVTYPANVIIWHLGVQYVSLQAGNTGNTPATEPTWWAIYSPPELSQELNAGLNTIGFTMQTATGDGTTTIDWKLGNKFKFTFGAFNETFTFTAPTNPCAVQLILVQDGAGSRTATWPATVKWPGGTAPTLSTASGAIDIVSLVWDGSSYYGSSSLDFS